MMNLEGWSNNLARVFLYNFILRLLFPAAAAGMALFAQKQGWGLLNYFVVPGTIAVIVTVITLDLVTHTQRVMVHAVPVFWCLHREHHADLDYDVTTARTRPTGCPLCCGSRLRAV